MTSWNIAKEKSAVRGAQSKTREKIGINVVNGFITLIIPIAGETLDNTNGKKGKYSYQGTTGDPQLTHSTK